MRVVCVALCCIAASAAGVEYGSARNQQAKAEYGNAKQPETRAEANGQDYHFQNQNERKSTNDVLARAASKLVADKGASKYALPVNSRKIDHADKELSPVTAQHSERSNTIGPHIRSAAEYRGDENQGARAIKGGFASRTTKYKQQQLQSESHQARKDADDDKSATVDDAKAAYKSFLAEHDTRAKMADEANFGKQTPVQISQKPQSKVFDYHSQVPETRAAVATATTNTYGGAATVATNSYGGAAANQLQGEHNIDGTAAANQAIRIAAGMGDQSATNAAAATKKAYDDDHDDDDKGSGTRTRSKTRLNANANAGNFLRNGKVVHMPLTAMVKSYIQTRKSHMERNISPHMIFLCGFALQTANQLPTTANGQVK